MNSLIAEPKVPTNMSNMNENLLAYTETKVKACDSIKVLSPIPKTPIIVYGINDQKIANQYSSNSQGIVSAIKFTPMPIHSPSSFMLLQFFRCVGKIGPEVNLFVLQLLPGKGNQTVDSKGLSFKECDMDNKHK